MGERGWKAPAGAPTTSGEAFLMAVHTSTVRWRRNGADFLDGKYSRAHTWAFDGGTVVPASSSPHVVPLPYSEAAAVDPEEAFVASLSSCHMLWFLSLAAQAGWVVDSYDDAAEGRMGRNDSGRVWVSRVTLRPRVTFVGSRTPATDELTALHRQAHDACFIASSVRTEVVCAPVLD